MAAKKKDNLKDMKEGELSKQLATLKEEIRMIRFKVEGSRSKNVKELGNLKREIARIMTRLHAK